MKPSVEGSVYSSLRRNGILGSVCCELAMSCREELGSVRRGIEPQRRLRLVRRGIEPQRRLGLVRRGNGENGVGDNWTHLDEQCDPVDERYDRRCSSCLRRATSIDKR